MTKDAGLKALESAAAQAEDNYRRAKAQCHPSQDEYEAQWHELKVAIVRYKKLLDGRQA